MNSNGQANLLLSLLAAVMVFIAGMLFINHVGDVVSETRDVNLDCTSPTISDGGKLTCLAVDGVIPILFVAIISSAVGIILARFIL